MENYSINPGYQKWLSELTIEQMKEHVIPHLMMCATIAEDVSISAIGIPYCAHSGDSLIPGQRHYEDDEE